MVLDVSTVWYWMWALYHNGYCSVLDVGTVLYWKRDCESVKRKCSGFAAGCIPSSFWTVIKGLAISCGHSPSFG